MVRYKDLTGKKFGRLTVLKYNSHSKHKHLMWKCECVCGKVINTLGYSLKNGETKSCGCLAIEMLTKRNKLKKGQASFNALLSSYKKGAKRRNLDFNLTKEQFKKLTQQNCYYCGIIPNRKTKVKNANGDYIYNGVDRKNNKESYTLKNSVSCCRTCNLAKHSMSINEFFNWLNRIHNYNKKKLYG